MKAVFALLLSFGLMTVVSAEIGPNALALTFASDSTSGDFQMGSWGDMSLVKQIKFHMFITGTVTSGGSSAYPYFTPVFVTMSGANYAYKWRQGNFVLSADSTTNRALNEWASYQINVDTAITDTANSNILVPYDASNVYYTDFHLYTSGFAGMIYIDSIYVIYADSIHVKTFASASDLPTALTGGMTSASLIADSSVTVYSSSSAAALVRGTSTDAQGLRVNAQSGFVQGSLFVNQTTDATVALLDITGKSIVSLQMSFHVGMNTIRIPCTYKGALLLRVRTASATQFKLICPR
jgi:hypothetical protein